MRKVFWLMVLSFVVSTAFAFQTDSGEDEKKDTSESEAEVYESVSVRQRADRLIGVANSASEGATGSEDLSLRPIARSGELLETIPGLVITQHSGDGKANQYFLRGFNLDHGTDLRINLDHMQINMPTHGHGQGYADLNFLIPELVDTVRFQKGPYRAESGDFSAAGATDIRYTNKLPGPLVKLSGGDYQFRRALLGWSGEVRADSNILTALEVRGYDGPWQQPNNSEKLNGLVKWSKGDAFRGHNLMIMGYDQSWRATDQIPLRAVDSGEVDRFGLIDPDLGGQTSRYSASYNGHLAGASGRHDWHIYLAKYDLSLYSNFTYFLENPEDGDEFTQLDDRVLGGLGYQYQWLGWWGSREIDTKAGLQLRADSIENGLYRSQNRQISSSIRSDEILQIGSGAYLSQEIQWIPALRTVAGLRLDHYWADVDDLLENNNSGNANDMLLSPKLSLIWQKSRHLEFYFNFGYGFHSNDARGTTIREDPINGEALNRVPALVRAKGTDIGMVVNSIPGFQSAFTVFGLELDSELVFVGDGGGTEAGRPSRRIGFEWANHYRMGDHIVMDLDLSWAQGRFTDTDPAGNYIPGAVERVAAAGIGYLSQNGFTGAIRYRHFGGVALVEDNSVQGEDTHQVNAQLSYRLGHGVSLGLDIFNAFDREDPDVQYFYASRLVGEPSGGVEDIHFHPIEKRAIRLFVKWGL